MKSWNVVRKQTMMPAFKHFDPSLLPWGLQTQMKNPYYYTPLLQLKIPSEQFAASMRYLQRKRTITNEDLSNLTEAVVAEYVAINNKEYQQREKTQQTQQQRQEEKKPELPASQESTIPQAGYYKNYVCRPSPQFGGVADYMLYCSHARNFVPILHFKDYLNLGGTVAAAMWNLSNKPHKKYGFALQTDGNSWQMVRIDRSMKLEKTCLYQANNLFHKFYEDPYHQQLVLGLIDEALDQEKLEGKALRAVYDYIDEKRYSLELPEGQQDRPPLVSRLIRRLL